MAADSLDDIRRVLYALAPELFVARRSELARDARSAGDRPVAQAIMALRKPSRSASLLNRLAAARPARIAELLELGAEFRAAQTDPDPDRLFGLTRRRRSLVRELAGLAAEVAGGDAPTPAVRDELVGTLNAAAADEAVGARLIHGELNAAVEWSGLAGSADGGPTLVLISGGRSTAGKQGARRTPARTGEEAEASSATEPDPAAGMAAGPAEARRAGAAEAQAQARAKASTVQDEARREAARQRAQEAQRSARARIVRQESTVARLTAKLGQETARLDEARAALAQAEAQERAVSEPRPAPGPDR